MTSYPRKRPANTGSILSLAYSATAEDDVFDIFAGDRPTFPSPSSILLHGVEATGKSLTIKTVLNAIDAPSAIVRSQECITTRHLLERTVTVVKEALVAHGLSEEANGLDGRLAASDDDSEWLWARFTAAVWDSLGQPAARSVPKIRDVCARLWPPFIKPIVDGHYGAREFSKLLVKNRSLFQSEDALIDSIIPTKHSSTIGKPNKQFSYALPYYPTHLLISAYLASHNPSKHDITLFSKTSLSKRRKRGGGTALTSKRDSKHRKISRRLLGPQPFALERLFAIFHAILPHPYVAGGADIMCQVATLVGLRLIVKAGSGGDVLEGGGKWRVNVGWEFVRGVARGVSFDVENYLTE
ncbi:MAG: hypothetical protein ASARMPREDX12_003415 [Alectoria sarmentosa]|nr:MAG: hypothetical protein ASARMPREDX12_003415 [Alectoria sarmentosa]